MKKLSVVLFAISLLSGCVRFKSPTQELEIDATPLMQEGV